MNKRVLIILFFNLFISITISFIGLIQLKISGLSSNNEYYLNYSIYSVPATKNTESFINLDNKYNLHNVLVTNVFGENLISLSVNRVFGVDYLHYLYFNSNKLIKFNIINKSTLYQLNHPPKIEVFNYLKHTLILFLLLTFIEWGLIKIRYLFLTIGKLFKFDLSVYNVPSIISISLFLSSIAIFSIAYFTQLIDSNIFFNSDILFLVDLLRDIFSGGSINDWYMPGQMSLFPDLVVIAIIMEFTKNVYYLFYWVGIVQILLYFLLCYFVLKSILDLRISLFLSAFLIWVCVFLSIFYPNAFSAILIPGSHFGTLLNELLLLGIFIRLYNLKFRNLRLCIIFNFILILSIISDRFIILWFLLPLILSILIMIIYGSKPRLVKEFIYFIIASLVSSLIGIIILKIGFTHSFQPKTYFIFQDKRDFLKKIVLLIMGFKDQSFYTISIFDILVWMLAVSIYKNNFQNRIYLEQKPSYRIIYLLYLSCVPIMFFALVLISYFTFTPRYLLMISCVSVLIILIFISRINSKQLIVFLSVSFLYLVYNLAGLSIKTEYYPLDIKCIDNALSIHRAKYGIAQYWDARRFNYLTRAGIDIVPVSYLKDDVDLNNSNISSHFLWMEKAEHNRMAYDFALVGRESSIVTEFDLNIKKILTQNSNLIADVLCPEHRVLIFKPSTLVKY